MTEFNYNTQDAIEPATYDWYPIDGLSYSGCPNPVASNLETNTYTVIVTNVNGCTATDDITINADRSINVFIPNAFSPNDDSVNDTFIVHGGGGVTGVSHLKIYDRWGELIFEGYDLPVNDHSVGWDGTFRGKEMNPAVFVYIAEVEFLDGTKNTYTGEFTLLR